MHERENLPIRQDGERLPQRRRARIDVRADRRSAAAIEAMADGAILLEKRRAGREPGLVGLQRIGARRVRRWDAMHQQPGSGCDLDRRRRGAGA